jgi:hypothetical protein
LEMVRELADGEALAPISTLSLSLPLFPRC